MQKHRMRIPAGAPKVEWKTLTVDAEDPLEFSQQLQASLQELSDEGFTIVNQMTRGQGHIIVASRMALSAPPETTPLRRRVVEMPLARGHGTTTEEVLYHYKKDGQQEQEVCTGLVDALRRVKEHLGQDGVLPLNITTVMMTRFEPESFSMLLKMFADDLQPNG